LAAAICVWIWISASTSIPGARELSLLIGTAALWRYCAEATRSQLLPVGRPGMTALFEFVRSLLPMLCVAVMFDRSGLKGVFGLLACGYAILFFATFRILTRRITIRPFHYGLSALRPHIGFGLSNYVGTLAGTLQAQLCVYAAATLVTSNEAAYLGLSVQLFMLMQGIYLAARQALMPLLAFMEHKEEIKRMRYWGGLMMRYSAAGGCLIAVSWALIGPETIHLLLTDSYAPVYPCAIATAAAATFYGCAASCNGLMYMRGFSWAASATQVLYAIVTVCVMLVVIGGSPEGASYRIACVYAASALIFWIVAYAMLAATTGLWLPLRRTIILLLPLLLAWAVPSLQWSFTTRLFVLLVFLIAYPLGVVAGRLLPRSELHEIIGRNG
jgi:O-antigen/teichoic acid export membrane protein